MNDFLTTESISIAVSTLSLAFALWQYSKNINIKKLIVSEVVELHNNVSVALGATQAAKTANLNGQSPDVEIGRAEGLCQAILHGSAKLYCNIEKTKLDDIDDLISSGQLKAMYKEIYYSYAMPKRGFMGLSFKKLWRKI